MSQLSLIRAGASNMEYPATQDWKFAANKSLSSNKGLVPSFTRASTGTYFNASGVLTSAAINAPRFDHVYNSTTGIWESRGLLIEEQRTNQAIYSDDLSNAAWARSRLSVAANDTVAPDGTTTADKLTGNATDAVNNGFTYNNAIITFSGTVLTASIFYKKGNKDFAKVGIYGTGFANGVEQWFNIFSGAVGSSLAVGTNWTKASASISYAGNGWYRCTLSVSVAGGATTAYMLFTPCINADNTNGITTGDYTYAWGAQLEAGAFPTSYIPTTSASATRSADVCQVTGASFSGFWSAYPQSIAAEFDCNAIGTQPVVMVDDNTAANQAGLLVSTATPTQTATVASVAQVATTVNGLAAKTVSRFAASFAVNDASFSVNGGASVPDTTCTMPAVTMMRMGSDQAGNYLNGHIGRLRTFNKRLTDKQLEDLGRPELSKSLDLQFASTKSLTPLVGPMPTFTRASAGWYTDSTGTLVSANINYCLYSEDLTNAAWTKDGVTVTQSAALAPDGTYTAMKLTENAGAGYHRVYQSIGSTLTQPTISCYVKPAGRTWFNLALYNNSSGKNAFFNLTGNGSTGTTSGLVSSSIQNVGNGWYRLSVTLTSGPANGILIQPQIASADGVDNYTGDGTSGVYLWGCQIEDSSAARVYTKTAGSAIAGPRFDHTFDGANWISRGLLIEEQRTNLCLWSNDFTQASWSKQNGPTVTGNATGWIDGTATASQINYPANSLQKSLYRSYTGTVAAYTASVYAKAGTANWLGLGCVSGNPKTDGAFFNLSSGTVGTVAAGVTAAIQSCGNGWFRCSVTKTHAAATSYIQIEVHTADNQAPEYTSNGTETMFVAGAQVELGSAPSSYIQTTSASVTRSADVCQITGTNFSGMWNASEASVTYSILKQGFSGSQNEVWAISTDSNNVIEEYHNTATNRRLDVRSGGTVTARFDKTDAAVPYIVTKSAAAWRTNDAAQYTAGSSNGSDNTVTIPAATKLELGNVLSSNYGNLWMQSFQLYTIRLPNRLLIAKSS